MIENGLIILASFISAIFAAGGFYILTNWRIRQLEEHNTQNKDIRDRLIKIEANQEQMITLFKTVLNEKNI